MPPSRPLAMLAAAGAAIVAATAATTPALAKTPVKHVICDRAAKWIPVDYTGGCYLTFSPAVRTIAYDAFEDAAKDDPSWLGANDLGGGSLQKAQAVKAMTCRRGGMAGLVKLNRFHAGMCTWNDTFGHFGLGDHADHTWACEVTVVLRSGLNGKTRTRKGRMAMQWDVTGAPLQDIMVVGGEYPYCGKAAPEDTWLQG